MKISNIINYFNKKRLYIISLICFVISISLFLCSVLNYRHILDADMSAELILGNLLAKENKLFATTSWTYSTQFRFLDIPFIYGLFFRFINNWTHVHIMVILIVNCIILIVLYWLCKLINQEDWYFFVAAAYMFPTCFDTCWFYHIGLLYEVYVIYTISIVCLCLSYIKNKRIYTIICASILSFTFCLEGIRIILLICLPLLCSSILCYLINIKEKKEFLIFSMFITIFSIGGYMVYNQYIIKIFYGTFIDSSTICFNIDFNRLLKYFNHLLYSLGGEHSILGAIILISSIVAVMINIRKRDNTSILILSLFYLINFLGVSASSIFSTNEMRTRYLLQATIYAFIIIIITIYSTNFLSKGLLITIVMSISLFVGAQSYIDFFHRDRTTELEYISSELVNQGYLNGYSTYWSADILTELSNGQIEVWFWGDEYNIEDSFREIDRMHPCLQLKSHSSTVPKGKIFILLDNYFNNKLLDLTWNFTDKDILFTTNNYIVYSFESYDTLKKIMEIG